MAGLQDIWPTESTVEGEQGGAAAEPGGGQGGLDAGVAGADDDDVVVVGVGMGVGHGVSVVGWRGFLEG